MAFRFILSGMFVLTANFCAGQVCKTDAKSVCTKEALRESIRTDPRKKLVALQKAIPGLVVDLRYATTNNFTKTILYSHPVALLRQEPANALGLVQAELKQRGLGLKIYDALRPFAVTCKIWHLVPDRRYAANPRKGSNHNRGLAVDLTIIDLKTGKELDMGTGFDNFSDSAHHDFYQFPAKVIENRRLLKNVMRKYGFGLVPTEWWHYQWHDKDYEIIDLDFDELKEFLQ